MTNVRGLDISPQVDACQKDLETQMNTFLGTLQTKDLIDAHTETISIGINGEKLSSFGYVIYNT